MKLVNPLHLLADRFVDTYRESGGLAFARELSWCHATPVQQLRIVRCVGAAE